MEFVSISDLKSAQGERKGSFTILVGKIEGIAERALVLRHPNLAKIKSVFNYRF